MNPKEEGILLGELKAFKRYTEDKLEKIEKKVDSLDKFKLKVTIIMASVMGGIEFCFRVYEVFKK